MIRKLLVGFDGSPQSLAAFEYALELARKFHASLEVIAVARPPDPPVEVETEAVIESAAEHYQQQFDSLRKLAQEAGIEMKAEVHIGHPVDQILHRAEVAKADAIVMAHQSRNTLGQWLLGSVTDRVMHHAKCTVIVVKGATTERS